MVSGTAILCDCCDCQKLGVLRPHEGLEIRDGRHGTKHTATIPPLELLQRLAGTQGREAVMRYVESVMKGGKHE